jgi:2-keto-3-deoxy-6-phosphogluconate aldolase
VGVGGSLTNKDWIAAGEWGKIAAEAENLVANCKVQ